MTLRALLVPLAFACCACAPEGPAREHVLVLAAASLRDAGEELFGLHERAAGVEVEVEYAGSNLLSHQLLAGARADVFLSAGPGPMDRVEAAGLLAAGTRVDWLSNQLVVVHAGEQAGPLRASQPLEEVFAERLGRIALANPEAVPAGVYARAWLESLGLWASLEARIVPARDVRAALALVESGGAGAGVVYATDLAATTRARIVHRVPPGAGPRIVYPAALLAEAPSPQAARDLLGFLAGPEAREVLARHGFTRAERGGR